MDKFSIIIPSRNRKKSLEELLLNIKKSDKYDIKIIFDADKKNYDYFKSKYDYIQCFLSKDHIGSVKARNLIIKNENDGVCYIVDDVVFPDNYFDYIFDLYNNTFLDDDGVIGIRQKGKEGGYCPTGMALVGKKFLSRYPNKELFYPKFFHFAAQEINRLCMKIEEEKGKKVFLLADKYSIGHKGLKSDKTGIDARKFKKRDLKEKEILRKTTYTWGNVDV